MPNTMAEKINVNEIGKPTKITKIFVPNMIKPMVGFDKFGRAEMMSLNHLPPGVASGYNTAMTAKLRGLNAPASPK